MTLKSTSFKTLLVGLLLCNLVVNAEPPKKLTVSVYRIEDLLEYKQPQLPFNQILTILDQRISSQLDYQFYYPLRAVEKFDNHETDCLFPGSSQVNKISPPPLESAALQTAKAYFIGLEAHHTADILDTNRPSLIIGFRRGNTYGGNISKLAHHNLMALNSGANIRQLLALKRIDAFLGYLPDALPIIHAVIAKPLTYTEAGLFYSQNDSFLCHNTAEMQSMMKIINIEIEKMHNTGEIQKILQSLNNVSATQSFAPP